ncbi:MAG: TRAP transporter large permease [Bacteroidota bacterium]
MNYEVIMLVLVFVILMFLNVPIAFCLLASAVVVLSLSTDFIPVTTAVAQQTTTGIDSFVLLAIPFFILSGLLMGRGGIANRLIEFAKSIVGWFPGGLAFVNVVGSMLFGSIAGSAAAAVSAIGGFMIPSMTKEGYSREFSTSLTITAATTGLLIPPSNILIVYSLASGGISIAALFLAGYIPGILVGLSLMSVATIVALKKGEKFGKSISFKRVLQTGARAFLSLLLVVIVIGGIIAGIFTATEAAAIAVVYSFILGVIVYREISIKEIPEILINTVTTTAIVMLLIGASMALSWVLSYLNIPQNLSAALLALSDNPFVILLIINLVLLFVGTFMDMTPAVLIFTPIFLPVAINLGIDPIHFGIIMVLNLCIGLATPPVGTLLFLGVSIGKTTVPKVIKPLLPMYIAMILALLIITFFPQLSLFLPSLITN